MDTRWSGLTYQQICILPACLMSQVVVTDRAPATSFLETWARISRPHRLRVLADDPFPPNTCFRSAYHVYTFAAGIGYNTNPATIVCESPVIMSLSHWLRQVYGEGDPATKRPASMLAAEAVAGPATQEAGIRGLKRAADGIVVKNVVWLSRRCVTRQQARPGSGGSTYGLFWGPTRLGGIPSL